MFFQKTFAYLLRKVLELWSQQVSDLERALEQIDSVGESRQALKEQYTEGRNAAPRLMSPNAPGATRGGRKPKSEAAQTGTTKKQGAKSQSRALDSGVSSVRDSKTKAVKKAKKSVASGKTQKVEAKYKDPNSEKTWSGRGHRPAWFVGDSEQYRIHPAVRQPELAIASSVVH